MNDREIIESLLKSEIAAFNYSKIILYNGLNILFGEDGNVISIQAPQGADFINDFMHRLKAIAQSQAIWEAI